MQVTRTPADVLATLSRRYREHYGVRLGIYAVPEFPFSDEGPEGKDDDVSVIEVVVVLQGPYDHFEETDPVVDHCDGRDRRIRLVDGDLCPARSARFGSCRGG